MKLAQLKTLVKNGESERLEFKATTKTLSAGMQTVCAFLNSDRGGVVIFGVKDNGEIIGQEVSDNTRQDIAKELEKIQPYVQINVSFVRVADRKQAIVLTVEPGEKKPYTYDWRPYVRSQSTTRVMTQEVFAHLYSKVNFSAWESSTNNNCTIKDLDHKRIKEIVEMAIYRGRLPASAGRLSIPIILDKFELMVGEKLTNAAVILFCKNERKQFIQSTLKFARFKGIDKREFINSKDLRANALDLFDDAMDFLIYYLPVAARIEEGNPIRVETPTIPYKVLREAVANALIHRDYSYEGGSMEIALYDDRITVSNHGSLPVGIRLNQLSKEHRSIPRNKRIAGVFYLSGIIEKWGRGTLDMIRDSKLVGNPPPRFDEAGDSFSVTLPFKESIRTVIYEKPLIGYKLTMRQKQILDVLQNGPLSRQELMEKIHVSIKVRSMQLELNKLQDMGLIESRGKTKAITWSLREK